MGLFRHTQGKSLLHYLLIPCHNDYKIRPYFHKIDKVKALIEKKIQEFISSGVEWIPLNKVLLNNEKTKSVLNFLETLEDDEDVQNVYANLDIDNNFSGKISIT